MATPWSGIYIRGNLKVHVHTTSRNINVKYLALNVA